MTTGQIITEFIVRAEAFIAKRVPLTLEAIDDGMDTAWSDLYFIHDLFIFLVELQSLYNDWNTREILSMIDYFDSTYNLKALQSSIPDPYKSYENAAITLTSTTTLEVPNGDGLLLQQNGKIILYPNESIINSYYGLE